MEHPTELEKQIEGILFFKGEPLKRKTLAKILGRELSEVDEAVATLDERLKNRGITLLMKDDTIALGTHPDLSDLILAVRKEELSRDIGKAGLETLSIILYKGPIGRSEVDYIRGVNSSFIIRNLLVRGLVERVNNPNDSRSFLYKPTLDLLSFLGITRIEELPEFEKVQSDLEQFILQQNEEEEGGGDSSFAENITQQ